VYVAFHRNVPMLVHILFWYFGVPALLPQFATDWLNSHGSEFIMSCIAISLVMSAYICEDLRSAVRGIPPGQVEASRALGLSFLQTMRKVILPQAFRIAIPPLLNQTLLLLKNTSLAMAIGVTELTAAGREVENYTFRTFEAYAVVTVIYLVLSFIIMGGGALLQRRYRPLGAR
jgi:polar amino acid transport system permease protein